MWGAGAEDKEDACSKEPLLWDVEAVAPPRPRLGGGAGGIPQGGRMAREAACRVDGSRPALRSR